MQKKIPFVHKLLNKLDRLDQESVQNYVRHLANTRELYEEILQQIGEGIIVTNPQGKIRFINRQAAIWLGIPSPNEENLFIADIFTDSEIILFITRNLLSLTEKKIADFKLLSPREIFLRVSLWPLESVGGQEVLILLEPLDAERTQGLSAGRISQMESLIHLTAGIAHEIGNPLNSISIHLQLLRKQLKDLPENKRKNFEKAVDVISTETARLDKIIKDFLKATRKTPLRFKLEELNGILEEALQFMEPELVKNRIHVLFHQDPTLPLFLLDRERLYQTFINLIKNAMEAMPGGGNLKITLSHKEKAAILIFKDTGTGIADTDLPHIFEPYYTTKKEGSGLGLMTVFNAISEHGGKIEVASKIGKGTVFTLLLPIRQPKLQLPQYKTK